uniref:Conserved oligomeric Golgi complex subunit 7 n=1 Tax=Clastoptera arizonana TaxID=38151 RepID=A0A1B6DV36_9HEMI
MDISAFSDDNFEVKEWINRTFRSLEAQENKNAFVNSMVKKLQLYVQQVNSTLEDTSQQVLHCLPRVMRDTEMLHHEAIFLQNKMQSIKEEIVKVEKDTGESMASLERLDRMKTELKTAKEALHEADNWIVLATDIEEVFESRNIDQISSKIVSMQQSLNILANVIDYEERKMQLEGLKNRLEAIASPQLVEAFTSNSVEQSRRFVNIFSSMERLPQLLKYYHKCQKGALCQVWRRTVEEQDQNVMDWMNNFYDSLLLNWHQQVKWCQLVVGSVDTLIEVYADVLVSLDPSFNTCIDAALKQHDQPLFFLMELKEVTKSFESNLQPVVHSQGKDIEGWKKLLSAIYSPYSPYISKYETFEKSYMQNQLLALKVTRDDLMDTVQGLSQSISSVISIANEAKKRCLQFTEGVAFPGLVKALLEYFHYYLEQYNYVLRQLQMQTSEQEDWNMFQMCLTLLQTVGDLLCEVKHFDCELIQIILESCRKPKLSGLCIYAPILLSDTTEQELNKFIEVLQNGSQTSLLESITTTMEKLCRDVHFTTYQVIFAPISIQLDSAKYKWSTDSKVQNVCDMPDYSFAPQEYITQILMLTDWRIPNDTTSAS